MIEKFMKGAGLSKAVAATAVVFMMGAAPAWAQSSSASTTGADQSTSTSSATSPSAQSGSSGSTGASGDSSGATGTSSATGTSGAATSGATGTTGATGSTGATGTTSTDTAGASGTVSASKQIGKADRQLMKELALSNISEIAAAKLALEKASSEEVKKYAQQMIDDHTTAQNQLQQLAQQKGVTLPSKPDAKHQAMMKKMEGMSGDAFDKHYIQHAGMQDHHKADKLVDRASARAKDPDLKALVAQMEPTIQQHLKMATDMRKGAMGGATSGATGTASGAGSSGSTSGASSTTGK